MVKHFKQKILKLKQQRRDPRYIFVIAGASVIFAICFLQVLQAGLFDSFERPVFGYFNSLPSAYSGFMSAITQLGGLGGLIIWCGLAWYLVNKRAAYTVLATGWLAWTVAKIAKAIAHRGRPGEFVADINLSSGEILTGYGFPSGHATLSAAVAAVLYYQIEPKYRKYLLLTVLLVGVSRMYLGAHFPLDIFGGWALGALIGAGIVTIFGVSVKGLQAAKLKQFLNSKGMAIASLKFADVDARGSQPIFIKDQFGEAYFGKVFGKQEHAADWLFKIFRLFRYKNLQAEEPHLSSRRNVEIEAFAMLWAKQAGVRVARICDIYHFGTYWISIQQKLDAIALSEHGHILQTSLDDAWRQVQKLHDANIAHRDLRSANLMIDKKGQAWIIDFGFAEVSASRQRQSMDNAELLMSMALVAGVDRTILAAKKAIGAKELKKALPYLQNAVFSGATTKQLKGSKDTLNDLKSKLKDVLNLNDEVDEAQVIRINRRKLINISLLAIFIYVIAPQFGAFKEALQATQIDSYFWILALAIASLSTYVLTGIIYAALANVPLKVWQASLVQLAASFISKIVPGGIGNTGLNAKYMTRAGMDTLETTAVITSQAFIGFVMFMVPLGLFLLLNGSNIFNLIDIKFNPVILIIVLAVAILILIIAVVIRKIRLFIIQKISAAIEGVRNMSLPPRDLAISSLASLAVTAAYIFCLYASLKSIGVTIGISGVVLAYATAVIAKSAIPTPGGLGPVEAAMIGTLLAIGVSNNDAISGVIFYRTATFWIPIPFSLLAYKYITNKKLI